MNVFKSRCGCGRILARLEQCDACTSKRRAEAVAKAGPREEIDSLGVRVVWTSGGWRRAESRAQAKSFSFASIPHHAVNRHDAQVLAIHERLKGNYEGYCLNVAEKLAALGVWDLK